MLTRRGWTVGIGSAAAAGAGRLFGMGELLVLACAGIALIAGAVVWTRTRRVRLRIQRWVQPARVHAGGKARVQLALTNLGGPAPVLQLTDPVTGTLGARLQVGPLLAAERLNTSYLLPTQRRGRLEIGPAEVDVVDPLGLSRTSIGAGPRTTLVVYPATQTLVPPRLARGPEPLGLAADVHTLQRIGEDFYALRDYTAGDDVRRIHWPSTARLGRPMVREDEVPRRSRVTVVLDTRSTAFDPERFELAVSVAASVVLASAARHDPLRLLTVAGADTGFVTSGEGLAQLFDHLADVSTSAEGSLRHTLAAATTTAVGAVVVVLGGTMLDAARDADAISAARTRTSSMTVVRVSRSGDALPAIGPDVVDISNPVELGSKWAAAQASSPASAVYT
ncbi:DUF58 domain-containing protein [Candidatus Poriferisodalis sp.]|uniref:DUF58 domain-containing protein n=1 Tax=Candidatus Poriferisodalis sp. TaxID=3101277 RepID=UPI003B014900